MNSGIVTISVVPLGLPVAGNPPFGTRPKYGAMEIGL